jgi:hypothetical protein
MNIPRQQIGHNRTCEGVKRGTGDNLFPDDVTLLFLRIDASFEQVNYDSRLRTLPGIDETVIMTHGLM